MCPLPRPLPSPLQPFPTATRKVMLQLLAGSICKRRWKPKTGERLNRHNRLWTRLGYNKAQHSPTIETAFQEISWCNDAQLDVLLFHHAEAMFYAILLGWAAGRCAPPVVPASFKHLKSTVPLPLALAPKCCCWFCHDTSPNEEISTFWNGWNYMNHISILVFLSLHHEIKKPSMPDLRPPFKVWPFNTFQPLEMFHLPSWRLTKGRWTNEWNEIDSYGTPSEPRIVGMHFHPSPSITADFKICPGSPTDYFFNGFSVKTFVLVGSYNQKLLGTILLMVTNEVK